MSPQDPNSLDFSRFQDDPVPASAVADSLDFSRFQDDDSGDVAVAASPDGGLRAEFGRRFDAFKAVQQKDRQNFYERSGLRTGALSGIIDMISDTVFDTAEATGHPYNTAAAILSGLGQVPGGLLQAVKDPVGTGKSLVEGVVAPLLLHPIEVITSRDMFGEGFGDTLTPEERYVKGRSAAANWFSMLVGAKAGQVVKAGFLGQEAAVGTKALRALNKAAAIGPDDLAKLMAKDVDVLDVYKLTKTASKPEFMMKVKAGAVEGAVGGAAVGYLEGSGYEGRFAAATTLAAIALPFGYAAEVIIPVVQHMRGKTTAYGRATMIAETAAEIMHLRGINEIMHKTPLEIAVNGVNLLDTQSLALTAARNAIEYVDIQMGTNADGTPRMATYGKNMSIVPQVKNPAEALLQLGKGETKVVDTLKDTTAVDESGAPIEFFHGTTEGFTEFARQKQNSASRYAGIHFTDDPGAASEYAGGYKGVPTTGANVHPVHLDVRNTFKTEEYIEPADAKRIYRAAGLHDFADEINDSIRGSDIYAVLDQELRSHVKASEALEKAGYDSLYDDDAVEWVVFDPKNIVTSFAERKKAVEVPASPFASAIHARSDGLFDVLIAPVDTPPRSIKFFEKTGFSEGQQVGYNGSESFFIETAARTDPRSQFKTVNLVPFDGGDVIKDVPISSLTRPTSRALLDLHGMQGRLVNAATIVDPSSGYAMKGGNSLTENTMGARSTIDMQNAVHGSLYGLGKTIEVEGDDVVLYDKRINNPDPDDFEYGDPDPATRQVLKPGINHITVPDPDHPGLNQGIHIYVGGARQTVKLPMQDGSTVKLHGMQIGEPGTVLGYTTWHEELGADGKTVIRGSDSAAILTPANFDSADMMADVAGKLIANTKPWDDLRTARLKTIRTPVSIAMDEARFKDRVFVSHSSESVGSQSAHARRMNMYFPDEVVNRFGYMTPEVMLRGLFSGFMDYIGMIGDNIDPNPSTHITHVAQTLKDPSWSRATSTGKQVITVEAKPGTTLKKLHKQVDPHVGEELLARKQPMTEYVTEDGVVISEAQAVKQLNEQHQRGEVAVFQDRDWSTPRDMLPFDQLVDGFARDWEIRPEMIPALKLFFEQEMGKELLGNTSRVPNANKMMVPALRERVAQLDKELGTAGSVAVTDPQYAKVVTLFEMEQQRIRDVLQKRIELAENPQPKALAPEELSVFKRLVGEARKARAEAGKNLLNLAHEFGYIPEREGGVIKLRDAESGTFMPVTFINEADAAQWVKDTGQPTGVALDGGGNNAVPPSAVIGGALPPSTPPQKPFEVPFEFTPNSRVTKIMNFLDAAAPWFTPKRAHFSALDDAFGTTFLRDVYFPLQIARMKLEATKRPHLLQASEIEKSLIKAKIPRDRWATISDYREAMSPQNVIDELYTTRKLTDVEQKYANEFAKNKIDTVKVYEYERAYNAAKEAFDKKLKSAMDSGASQDVLIALSNEWTQTDKQLVKTHMMDDAHLNAHSIFTKIRASNPAVVRLDGVTRLTRAIIDQSPDKATFAAANNMTPIELAAADKLTQLYKNTGKQLGVDQSITNYMNHYKVTGDFTPAELKSSDPAVNLEQRNSKFASDLMRSGAMNVHERDPIKAYVAYVNAGFADRMFNKQWDKALSAVTANVNKLPAGREAAMRVAGDYVYGIKGTPHASDEMMQSSFDVLLKGLNIKFDINVRKDLVNTYMAASSGALLGMRPMQGIRDFAGFSKLYYTRFGAQRYAKALELAFTRDANGVLPIRKLAEEGTTPGLGVVDFLTDDELTSGMTGKAGNKIKDLIFKASKLGMDTSGQTSAYGLAHAMAYLEVRNRSSEWLNKLHSGSVTKAEAYKQLSINSYDVPVIKIFDDMVKDGKFTEATEFLAQTTGGETAFIYGLANHAYGWGSNFGRLAGQFGTYALWTRNALGRVAGRGTAGERAAGMARLAAAETATFLTGRTLGFDMSSWSLPMGMLFAGGPMADKMQQIQELLGARGTMRQGMAVGQWKAKGGVIPGLSTNLPGGMALADYYKAYTARQNRFGWVPVIGRGLGFKIDETQRSFLDVLADEHPKLKK